MDLRAAWLIALAALALARRCCAEADAPAPAPHVRFVFDTSRATPGVIDAGALRAAAGALESMAIMRATPPPARAAQGVVSMMCDPYENRSVPFDIGGALRGDVHVVVYTFTQDQVWTCQSQLAHVQLCATENVPFAVPLAAYMNVCADQRASMLHPESTYALRYRAYMHELIHVLGFTEEAMAAGGVIHDVEGAPGLKAVRSPLVSAAANTLYSGCPHGINASYIVNAHWDPFFVGDQELMTSRINADSVLSPITLALLADIGPYDVNLTATLDLPTGLLGWPSARDGYGCRVAVVECGFYPSWIPASSCLRLGVQLGQWVAAPSPVDVGARSDVAADPTPQQPTPAVAVGSAGGRVRPWAALASVVWTVALLACAPTGRQ